MGVFIFFFLEFSCFLYDQMNVGNSISGSSTFSKSSFYIWKFSVHVLLKSNLKDFEHNLTSVWNEYHYMIIVHSLGLEWKLTIASSVATDEFSKFADALSVAL